jgi:hypothetical protein
MRALLAAVSSSGTLVSSDLTKISSAAAISSPIPNGSELAPEAESPAAISNRPGISQSISGALLSMQSSTQRGGMSLSRKARVARTASADRPENFADPWRVVARNESGRRFDLSGTHRPGVPEYRCSSKAVVIAIRFVPSRTVRTVAGCLVRRSHVRSSSSSDSSRTTRPAASTCSLRAGPMGSAAGVATAARSA